MLFDLVRQAGGLLDARGSLGSEVQADFARIDRGEEVPAKERHQGQGYQAACRHQQHELARPPQGGFKQALVAVAQSGESGFEAALESLEAVEPLFLRGALALPTQQVLRERRHQRERQKVRGQYRECHRLGQRDEQVMRDAGQEEHRREHDADRERGHQRRQGDLGRSVHDGLLERLAQLELVRDVLDHHRGVVDQDAHRQSEAAQRHDVDTLAERRQRGERRQD